MTEEVPKRPAAEPLFCTECNAAVRLERCRDGERLLRCACTTISDVEITADTPVSWS